jgi:hypothetical protein
MDSRATLVVAPDLREILMRFAFLCAAALIAAPTWADELIASNGKDSVRLSDRPCTSEQVLGLLKPTFRAVL